MTNTLETELMTNLLVTYLTTYIVGATSNKDTEYRTSEKYIGDSSCDRHTKDIL